MSWMLELGRAFGPLTTVGEALCTSKATPQSSDADSVITADLNPASEVCSS